MTTPPITATKAKAWWALIIPQLPALVSLGLQFAGSIPDPYGAIFAGVLSLIGVITGTVVHQVSNAPTGMVLVPVPAADGAQANPYK